MNEIYKEVEKINIDEDALYFSYTKGVNSIRADTIKLITFRSFLSSINDL
jgi:hypothetical protein|tara:strand:+ start:165 stop:314 length:150 start_codon:yes stop_codon:yes gene_type:complete